MDDVLILISSEEEVKEIEDIKKALNSWDLEKEQQEYLESDYYDSIKRNLEDDNFITNF